MRDIRYTIRFNWIGWLPGLILSAVYGGTLAVGLLRGSLTSASGSGLLVFTSAGVLLMAAAFRWKLVITEDGMEKRGLWKRSAFLWRDVIQASVFSKKGKVTAISISTGRGGASVVRMLTRKARFVEAAPFVVAKLDNCLPIRQVHTHGQEIRTRYLKPN